MYDPALVDLLLIGKTGNGKSAAGNSILRRNAFKSRSSTNSVTLEVDYEVSLCNGRVVKVVDCPGVGDTRMSNEEAVNSFLEKMEYAIAANPRGYHAFCLVVRFGGRFTGEDKDTIDLLKKCFGQEFVKKFCILVMTCGDWFETASEEPRQTFEDWCNEQEGEFKVLLNECDNRIVLFDNLTKDKRKKEEQVAKLLKVVDSLSSSGKRYTDQNFQNAKEARERITVESQMPMIQEETMAETSLILQQLQNIQLKEDPDKNTKLLEQLLLRTQALKTTITSKDRGTGALHALKSFVISIEGSVHDQIKFFYTMKEEQEKIRRHEEETKRKSEEERKRQREKFEKQPKADARPVEDQEQKEIKEQKKKEVITKYETQLNKKMEERQKTQEKECQKLEIEYKKVKTENDKGIFKKVVNAVSWPFRMLAN